MGYTDYNDLLILFRACLDADYYTVEESGSFSLVRDGERLYVFFEKSEGREDWQNNLDFASEAEKYGREGESFYVHRGFLRVWRSILPYIRGALLDLSVREIVSVGYSHGAALAVLCHEYVWHERPDLRGRTFGYGFGCPRVICGRVQREKERWADFYIIRNYDDIVTHLPPRALGYRHVGQMIVVGKAGRYSRIDAHRAENYIKELENAL